MSKLTDLLIEAMKGLEARHHEQDGWRAEKDYCPWLYNLYREPDHIRPALISLSPWIWRRAPTMGSWLRHYATVVGSPKGDILAKNEPPNLIGMALVAETFGVHGANPEEHERYRQYAARGGRFKELPEADESRIVMGCLHSGTATWTVERIRQTDVIRVTDKMDGPVPEGLRALCDGFLSTRIRVNAWKN